jgi:putative transposase
MTSPGYPNILSLYQRVVSAGVLEYLQKQAGAKVRRGVYSAQVVLWLMILQRLHAVGTLAVAVQLLVQGAAGELLTDCQRVRKQRISSRTGGYSQARKKLPTILFRQVVREMIEQLRKLLGLEGDGAPRTYVVDGSSVELEHSRELIKSYPPAENQHGVSHWPVLRMVVLHELQSGLAEEPSWGPMYGPKAVSEQELAAQSMERLPAGSVILGDRNFGVLWVAYEAQRRSLGVIVGRPAAGMVEKTSGSWGGESERAADRRPGGPG